MFSQKSKLFVFPEEKQTLVSFLSLFSTLFNLGPLFHHKWQTIDNIKVKINK